jgi:hypothetical protein
MSAMTVTLRADITALKRDMEGYRSPCWHLPDFWVMEVYQKSSKQ